MKYTIYLVKSPSGKKYIGLTKNLINRKIDHLYRAKNGSSLQFHQAIRKYSKENMKWEILKKVNTLKEAKIVERKFIKELDTYKNGYNMTLGGDMVSKNAIKGVRRYIKKTKNRDKRARECGAKEFVVYNYKGKFIGEYINVKRFCRENDIDRQNFNGCLAGRAEYVKKFIPFYKEEFTKGKLKHIVKKLGNILKNIEFEVYANEKYIGKWNKLIICARDLNLDALGVSRCLKGKRKTHKGYKFKLINN